MHGVQIPYILAQTTVFVPIAYWMIRFRGTAPAFFFFYFVFFLCADGATHAVCPGASRATPITEYCLRFCMPKYVNSLFACRSVIHPLARSTATR